MPLLPALPRLTWRQFVLVARVLVLAAWTPVLAATLVLRMFHPRRAIGGWTLGTICPRTLGPIRTFPRRAITTTVRRRAGRSIAESAPVALACAELASFTVTLVAEVAHALELALFPCLLRRIPQLPAREPLQQRSGVLSFELVEER